MVAMVFVVTAPGSPTSDVTASYEVQGDTIVLLEGEPDGWHQAAWDRWVQLVPASDRWRVGRFEAIEGSSDGQIEPVSDSLQVWILRISDLEPEILDVALIHELGHLITLGPGEIVPATDPSVQEECVTYYSMEGCAVAGGLFDRFVSEFWSESDFSTDPDAIDARYRADQDAYVTRYAATNPGEDIAETFVFFVYRLRPTGPTVAEQKIRMLWEFPELVELREALRVRLTTS